MRKLTKKDILAAFKTSSPIIVTFLVLGSGYGLLMQSHGYGPFWSLISGIIIFSGTAQFVSVTMLTSGSILMAGLTSLMISVRHLGMRLIAYALILVQLNVIDAPVIGGQRGDQLFLLRAATAEAE